MSRKADTIVTCDICDISQYQMNKRTETIKAGYNDPYEEWMQVNGKDVCPRCRHAVATAFGLGIAEELQWEDDKKASGQHGIACPECGAEL